MTAVVKVRGFEDRLACERCKCQIGMGWPPQTICNVGSQGSHSLEEDEPPIKFDAQCSCRCHAISRAFYQRPL